MKLDVDYVVKDGEVIIVDEFTGRLMYGRRFNEGLHQAIEAKEGVKVQSESKTLATITFQNYFRLYKKLSGMTGTAQTESEEFQEIYKLDVVEIPTNKPVLRKDLPDSVSSTLLLMQLLRLTKRDSLSLSVQFQLRSRSFFQKCSKREASSTMSSMQNSMKKRLKLLLRQVSSVR